MTIHVEFELTDLNALCKVLTKERKRLYNAADRIERRYTEQSPEWRTRADMLAKADRLGDFTGILLDAKEASK